jgi:hypothetical protein
MKTSLLALAPLFLFVFEAKAIDFYVYKVTAKLPVLRVVSQPNKPDKVVTRTLLTNDIINVALGRPLGSKIDTATEVLSVAGLNEVDSVNPPASKLVIFDPRNKAIKAVITTVSALNLKFVSEFPGRALYSRGNALGVSTQPFVESTANPTVAKFFAGTSLYVTGTGKGPGVNYMGGEFLPPVTGSATLSGRVKLLVTEKNATQATLFEGIVVKGTMSGGGKPVAYSE